MPPKLPRWHAPIFTLAWPQDLCSLQEVRRQRAEVDTEVGTRGGPGFISHSGLLPVSLEPSQIKKLFPIYFPGCKIIICLACQTAGRELQRNALSSSLCGFYHLLRKQERLALGPGSWKHFVQAGPASQCMSQPVLAKGHPPRHWILHFILAGRTRTFFHETVNAASPSATFATALSDQEKALKASPGLYVVPSLTKRGTRGQGHRLSGVQSLVHGLGTFSDSEEQNALRGVLPGPS